ncbi:TetR/AcrR family transcriptional regulator [Paraburkholderia sp. RL18-103-BIB-C]|jgi:AcrR family transcriptional regulator|uniref:TetR/AcrR family transcriptional regulator n=1 Tax=unclassified Paraburkholderia TaxID=2615204 RepID=UPI0038B6CF60
MPDTPNSRATRQRTQKLPAPARAPEGRQPRGARRKRETRTRLLEAAFRLMAEKGMGSVAINDITEAADVGFGSFYNHFESKEGIFAALVEWVFEEFAGTLDRLASGLSDPAEVVAVCVRHTLLRARREPVWAQILIREGFSVHALNWGLGQRLLRDSQSGISAKRFVVPDHFLCLISVTGITFAAIAAELHFSASAAPAVQRQKASGLGEQDFAERAAAVVLQALGLKRAEAERIAQLPLPIGKQETKGCRAKPRVR